MRFEAYTEKEDRKRYQILGLNYAPDSFGGIIRFNGLRASTFKDLIDNNFIDLNGTQNFSPTNKQFYDFICEHPDFHAHGYLVVNRRDDRRITIEGVESNFNTDNYEDYNIVKKWLADIKNEADELGIYDNKVWAWWD